MITLHEARARLVAMWSDRTVCVSAEAWRNCYTDGTYATRTNYQASIMPGLCGAPCTTWEGGDFEAVLLQSEAALRSLDSTDQDCEIGNA